VPRRAEPGRQAPTASEILGRSRAIVEVRHLVALAARSDVNLLISGETGTGKEVVSRAVHRRSMLADKPFVAHNCAATPPELFESQFFGYRKGAFTGAARDQAGLLESADGGVLLLDELGSMSIEHQAKLLRVMDDGEVRRVGDNQTRRVSVRFFAAVNTPPEELIGAGRLREDLYYRIRGIEFHLPPLRERIEDIEVFAHHFLGAGRPGFTAAAMDYLHGYDWPGNVRELRNVVQGAAAFAGDDRIDVGHLRAVLRRHEEFPPGAPRVPLTGTLKEVEEKAILAALAACGNNRSLAARTLGIDRSTLRRKLAAMGEPDRGQEGPEES
jgi:transcriptional regulator with PAS, ATPase and Fis domain